MSDPYRAAIVPVEDGDERPLWSVLIPTYNCARFLEHALRSVLEQDPGPEAMEILVMDDCSDRDDPEEVVRRLAGDRVRYLRQPVNVGKVRNYETGLQVSRGRLIHQLHGDDLVLPGFYAAMETAFKRHPEAGAFFCESDYIDEAGVVTGRTGREREETGLLENWLPRIAEAQRIQTPSMVVRREVYEHLGGFDLRLDCSEDWEMWIRISTAYPVGFCTKARAQYRTSAGNNTTRSIASGTRGRTQRLMFEIVDCYLPPDLVAEVRDARNEGQALFIAGQIPKVLRQGSLAAWFRLCREVLRFNHGPAVLRRILSLTGRALLQKLRTRADDPALSRTAAT